MKQEDLARAAASGDKLALQRLLLVSFDQLVAYVEPRIPPRLRRIIDAEDIVQDAFRCVHRDIGRFVPQGEGGFLAWARAIAEKRLLDRIRGEARRKRGGDLQRLSAIDLSASVADLLVVVPDNMRTPSKDMALREATAHLRRGIEGLPSVQREVMLLSLEGRSPEEIAAQLGQTKGAVRGLLHRAKAGLREKMGARENWMTDGDRA